MKMRSRCGVCNALSDKVTWEKGLSCEQLGCDANFTPIPTVSEWGLVIMTLLLLTGAKIYFGRRRLVTA